MSTSHLEQKILFSTKPSLFVQEQLVELLLQRDLNFHDQESQYAAHNFHAFPAKFPPQLPKLFIGALTSPGDLVLDPMQGSGTTLLEAQLAGRRALGFDIDPLASLITSVKSTPLNPLEVQQVGNAILVQATRSFQQRSPELLHALENRWDADTRQFVDQWFATDTQLELMAIVNEIEKIEPPELRKFFKVALSATIITKTGGVSLALDLAHTRPHRAKLVYSRSGEILEGAELLENPPRNLQYMTKTLRSPLVEFQKRIQANLKGLSSAVEQHPESRIVYGNAQALPIRDESVDLIVTSPPYASNAIDYMRAHKFSLVWMGYPIQALSEKRREYIGGEVVSQFSFEQMPVYTSRVIADIQALDPNKAFVLHRYYSEMRRVLSEMFRVLKPGRSSIVVVGNSEMRGRDTETQNCLTEIGKSLGFEAPAIGVRSLDRNRRMLPAGGKIDRNSQIQKRMHEEYVIGFYKP